MAALSCGCKPWIRQHTQYNFSQPAGDEFAPKWRSLLTSKPSYELDRARKEAPHLKFSNQKVQDKNCYTFLDRKNHKTSWKLLRFIGCAKIVKLIITHVELKMHLTISFRKLTVGTSHYNFFNSPISGMMQRRVILFILTIHKKCKITKIVQEPVSRKAR